jgi:mono/diheme cytochrome c family protein
MEVPSFRFQVARGKLQVKSEKVSIVITSEAKQSQLIVVEIASAQKDAPRNDGANLFDSVNCAACHYALSIVH